MADVDRISELFAVPEREDRLSDQLFAVANKIVVHQVDVRPDNDWHLANLCYLLMRTTARTAKMQLRQLAALARLIEELRGADSQTRAVLFWLWAQAVYDVHSALNGELEQIDYIASGKWYGGLPGDLDWLRGTIGAARDLLSQYVRSASE